jgi:hypothetical protein
MPAWKLFYYLVAGNWFRYINLESLGLEPVVRPLLNTNINTNHQPSGWYSIHILRIIQSNLGPDRGGRIVLY